jgi:hypothetical protein
MSRDQRTRLNVMISEQTAAGAQARAPGKTALTDEELTDEEKAALEQSAAEVVVEGEVETAPRKRSVFDSPHADDVARELGGDVAREPGADDD